MKAFSTKEKRNADWNLDNIKRFSQMIKSLNASHDFWFPITFTNG